MGFSLREACSGALKLLEENHGAKSIDFGKPVLSLVGMDSYETEKRWECSRKVYLAYESANIYRIGDRDIAIAVGISRHAAEPVDFDIVAFEFQSQEKLEDAIQSSEGFDNRLICGNYDGRIVLCKGDVGEKFADFLKDHIKENIESWPEFDTGIMFKNTFRYPVKKQTQYRPEIIAVIATAVEKALYN
jgi:hypothetical protein